MQSYNTLSEAIDGLIQRGYTYDFNIDRDCIVCDKHSIQLQPEDFTIDEVHRFEGDSNPDDESVLYGISSARYGLKGYLVNAYGIYNNETSSELIAKLRISDDK
jgi:hypothetical protein